MPVKYRRKISLTVSQVEEEISKAVERMRCLLLNKERFEEIAETSKVLLSEVSRLDVDRPDFPKALKRLSKKLNRVNFTLGRAAFGRKRERDWDADLYYKAMGRLEPTEYQKMASLFTLARDCTLAFLKKDFAGMWVCDPIIASSFGARRVSGKILDSFAEAVIRIEMDGKKKILLPKGIYDIYRNAKTSKLYGPTRLYMRGRGRRLGERRLYELALAAARSGLNRQQVRAASLFSRRFPEKRRDTILATTLIAE